jgi:hypothetical protein
MKATRLKFNKQERLRAQGTLDLIHTDICGPIGIPSMGGAHYILTFIDDFSRKSDVFLLKKKSDALDSFRLYKRRVEKETGREIKVLRSDNGSEFTNNAMKAFLAAEGIKHELTAIYSPQQNGTAERLNRTLLEKTRCLLQDAGMPNQFWGEAVRTANYIRNFSMTSICGDRVPMELWNGRRPNVGFFRIFGCKAYATKPKQHRQGKLDSRAHVGVFVGYDDCRKTYRIWLQDEKRLIHSRDVRFVEAEQGWNNKIKEPNEEKKLYDYAIININREPIEQLDEDIREESATGSFVADEQEGSGSSVELIEDETSSLSGDEGIQEQPNDEGNDEEVIEEPPTNHWADPRNLRERTGRIRPDKYTLVARSDVVPPKRNEPVPTLEELTREYGWRGDFDW